MLSSQRDPAGSRSNPDAHTKTPGFRHPCSFHVRIDSCVTSRLSRDIASRDSEAESCPPQGVAFSISIRLPLPHTEAQKGLAFSPHIHRHPGHPGSCKTDSDSNPCGKTENPEDPGSRDRGNHSRSRGNARFKRITHAQGIARCKNNARSKNFADTEGNSYSAYRVEGGVQAHSFRTGAESNCGYAAAESHAGEIDTAARSLPGKRRGHWR